jgi:hypothetical protein
MTTTIGTVAPEKALEARTINRHVLDRWIDTLAGIFKHYQAITLIGDAPYQDVRKKFLEQTRMVVGLTR